MSLFKPYSLLPSQVIKIIEEALDGTMDCRDWDNFISIPINGNTEMELVRTQCKELSVHESIEPSGIVHHSEFARQKLREILQMLKIHS